MEHLEVLSCCIKLSPDTWIRVLPELFPKVSEVVTGNCEFIVPNGLLCLCVVLKGIELLVTSRTVFYQFQPEGVGIIFAYDF